MALSGRFLETTAGRVYVQRQSATRPAGEPLVVLHGYLMSGWCFRDVIAELAKTHDVIAIDLPGFGESDRPSPALFTYDFPSLAAVVVEVLDRLGIARAAVLGHSMGGAVAVALGARAAERVERLVLIAPAVYPLPMPKLLARLLLDEHIGPFLWEHGFTRSELERQLRKQHFKLQEAVTDELVDYLWSRFTRAGGRAAAYAVGKALAALSPANAEPMRLVAPTLLVWGDEDRMVPMAHARRLERAIAGAKLAIVPACGHNVQLERPDELARQVRPFLADRTLAPLSLAPVPETRLQSVGGAS